MGCYNMKNAEKNISHKSQTDISYKIQYQRPVQLALQLGREAGSPYPADSDANRRLRNVDGCTCGISGP